MPTIRVASPAKLNLFLHITGKRTDGYHLLESLVVFTAFGDWLEIAPSEHMSLEITGPFAASLSHEPNNLALRAAQLLQQYADVKKSARITLHKAIPVGAGLGGGSANAAAVLRGLQQLWNLQLNEDALSQLARQLGSDVPVCLLSQTSWVTGIGEAIAPVAGFPQKAFLLVNPGIPLSTEYVFGHVTPPFTSPITIPVGLNTVLTAHNDLQKSAIILLPVIEEMLTAIASTDHCHLSRMTGSGATCFGMYDTLEQAQAAKQHIQAAQPSWWCVATTLYERAN